MTKNAATALLALLSFALCSIFVENGILKGTEMLTFLSRVLEHRKLQGSVVVLGNKTDLLEERQVEAEVAQQWAKLEKVKLWEVTTTDTKTLLEPFTVLASKLSQSQNKSAFPLPGRRTKGNNDDS